MITFLRGGLYGDAGSFKLGIVFLDLQGHPNVWKCEMDGLVLVKSSNGVAGAPSVLTIELTGSTLEMQIAYLMV